jgi:transcriptional regulator
MYNPHPFGAVDAAALQRLMAQHPLGMLVHPGPDGPDADHLPFEYDPASGALGTLSAHVARANPLWQRAGAQVLVVFRGAQGYVSPGWYPSKHETGRQVPTWNYEVVHARGLLAVHDDERWLRGHLARMTRQHEAGQTCPWKMGDAPSDYLADLLGRIVGIEIELSALEGKFKLGQNKEARDRLGAADALATQGHAALAQRMRDAG